MADAATRLVHLAADAADPSGLARFWSAALGWEVAASALKQPTCTPTLRPRIAGGLLSGFEDGPEVAEVLAVGAFHGNGHEGRCELGEAGWLPAVPQGHPG
jgi:hypothetical protein